MNCVKLQDKLLAEIFNKLTQTYEGEFLFEAQIFKSFKTFIYRLDTDVNNTDTFNLSFLVIHSDSIDFHLVATFMPLKTIYFIIE